MWCGGRLTRLLQGRHQGWQLQDRGGVFLGNSHQSRHLHDEVLAQRGYHAQHTLYLSALQGRAGGGPKGSQMSACNMATKNEALAAGLPSQRQHTSTALIGKCAADWLAGLLLLGSGHTCRAACSWRVGAPTSVSATCATHRTA